MGETTTRAAPGTAARRGDGAGTIVARGLARSFQGRPAVAGVSLELGPGGIVGLLGPNGSGKSTLLRMLVGLVRPDAGTAAVDGVELAGDGHAIRRRCTYAPGELHLYGELRAGEHLDWFLRGRERAAQARAREIAGSLGLPLEKRVRAYSHGMKRQLVFAAAMAPDVRVRILDEPTEGLDPSVRARVLERMAEDAARGTTVLLSSHHLGEVDRGCDRLVFLQEGRVLADETARSVAERARRLVRVAYDGGADLDVARAKLARIEGARVSWRGSRAVLEVESDPLAAIAAVCAPDGGPRPRAVEHGEISLGELYRDLYGVEGV